MSGPRRAPRPGGWFGRFLALLLVEAAILLAVLWWSGWLPEQFESARRHTHPAAKRVASGPLRAPGGRHTPEPLDRFLARIAAEPSPCPELLAGVERRLADPHADLDALFSALQRCKWRRPSYAQEKATHTIFASGRLDPWPEERAIRRVIGAMAARATPPEGRKVHVVPLGRPPRIDGVLGDEWRGALVFAPEGSRGRVLVMSDGARLFLGIAVPAGASSGRRTYDSARVLLHTHLSPAFANEYFFIYGSGGASRGFRTSLIRPLGAPPLQDMRTRAGLPASVRWMAFETIYDDGVFPIPRAASTVRDGLRVYEAAIDLAATQLPRGRPFALGLAVHATSADGRSRVFVPPFAEDFRTHGARWEVWLKVPAR